MGLRSIVGKGPGPHGHGHHGHGHGGRGRRGWGGGWGFGPRFYEVTATWRVIGTQPDGTAREVYRGSEGEARAIARDYARRHPGWSWIVEQV